MKTKILILALVLTTPAFANMHAPTSARTIEPAFRHLHLPGYVSFIFHCIAPFWP